MIVTWGDLRELVTATNIIKRYAVDENNIFAFFFFFDTVACLAVYLRKIVEKIPRKFILIVCTSP